MADDPGRWVDGKMPQKNYKMKCLQKLQQALAFYFGISLFSFHFANRSDQRMDTHPKHPFSFSYIGTGPLKAWLCVTVHCTCVRVKVSDSSNWLHLYIFLYLVVLVVKQSAQRQQQSSSHTQTHTPLLVSPVGNQLLLIVK